MVGLLPLTDATKSASNFKIVEELVDTNQPAGFVNSLPRDLGAQPDPKNPAGPDPKDPIAGRLALLYPTAGRIRFLSDNRLPCRQSTGRNLKLLLGSNPLADPLPSPAPGQFTKFIGQEGDVFYQIIRT